MKKVKLKLQDTDDGITMMDKFYHQAKKESWPEEEIKSVLNECFRYDLNYLVKTLKERCR